MCVCGRGGDLAFNIVSDHISFTPGRILFNCLDVHLSEIVCITQPCRLKFKLTVEGKAFIILPPNIKSKILLF